VGLHEHGQPVDGLGQLPLALDGQRVAQLGLPPQVGDHAQRGLAEQCGVAAAGVAEPARDERRLGVARLGAQFRDRVHVEALGEP
jgi:hypothetical protein